MCIGLRIGTSAYHYKFPIPALHKNFCEGVSSARNFRFSARVFGRVSSLTAETRGFSCHTHDLGPNQEVRFPDRVIKRTFSELTPRLNLATWSAAFCTSWVRPTASARAAAASRISAAARRARRARRRSRAPRRRRQGCRTTAAAAASPRRRAAAPPACRRPWRQPPGGAPAPAPAAPPASRRPPRAPQGSPEGGWLW